MTTSNQNGIAHSLFRHPHTLLSTLVLLAGAVYLLSGAPVRAERIPADCSGSGLSISLFTSATSAHVGDTIRYSISVYNGINGGGQIACDASAIEAYIVTPNGVTNTVSLKRTTLHQGESDFYQDAALYVVRAEDVRPDGTVLATARNIGVIHQNDTDSSGGGFQSVSAEIVQP